MTEIRIERQEVADGHPLQYKIITYKTVKDINRVDVQIEDTVEIKNTVEMNKEIIKLRQNILDAQVALDDKLAFWEKVEAVKIKYPKV